ncbi:chloride channel protein [Bordetella petrii]|uniref:chloride channel protein n=1 Tax=Bordetella petrii TaxID=94624 RepID=UPI001A96FB6E|nr:chloride channel protein [Bordetella petrii]
MSSGDIPAAAARQPIGYYLRLVGLAVVLGIAGALAAHVFRWGLDYATGLLFGRRQDITLLFGDLPWYARIAFPTLGGAIAALVLVRAQRREKAAGVVSEYLETIDGRMARIPVVPSLMRCVSSFVSIVSGGSIGKEGAMVQLSATVGSALGARVRALRGYDFRLAVAMAATGGLAAVYHTPLAAAIFVNEIAFGGFALRRTGYLFTAAAASAWMTSTMEPFMPLYALPAHTFTVTTAGMLGVGAVGLAAGLAGSLFLWSTRWARSGFARLHRSPIVRMSAGGLIVGLITLAAPEVTGNGFAPIERLLAAGTLETSLLLLLALKVAATAATVGSGAIGGMFTPSLLIGALAGSACAPLAGQWFGVHDGVLLGVLGMAAALSATTKAPFMSTLMVFEMTQESAFVFPLMIATAAAYAVSQLFGQSGAYEVTSRHRARDERRNRLADDTVAAVMRPSGGLASASASARQALQAGVDRKKRFVFVVDEARRFVGAIWTNDLLARAGDAPAPLLRDLVLDEFPVVYKGQPLREAWQIVVESPAERTPVLSDAVERRVIGFVQKSDLLRRAQDLFI